MDRRFPFENPAQAKRFVVLRHEMPPNHARQSHFDLMFEADDRLLTWTVPTLPEPLQSVKGIQLPDHRIAYLSYQGEVSGNRGSVKRIDQGSYWVECEAENDFELRLKGESLQGQIRFNKQSDSWQIKWIPDQMDTNDGQKPS